MNKETFIKEIESTDTDKDRKEIISKLYSENLPEQVFKIISNSKESTFFEDGTRILSYDEVINAEHDLHVEFSKKGIIPVADCMDNIFIVYDYINSIWSMFDITDEVCFTKSDSLEDLLK